MEECKSSVRGKVEHLFFYVKQMLGYRKTRYRGLGKVVALVQLRYPE